MRVAPAEGIDGAEDHVLFDDLTRHGRLEPQTILRGARLFSRPGLLVLAVTTTLGVHLLRVDAEGRPEPLAAYDD